jgi:hypothetical protein
VPALDDESCALYPRFLTSRGLEELRFVSAPVGPAFVHAKKHLGPILRVRSTLTRVDLQDRRVVVEVTSEQRHHFECLELCFDRCCLCLGLASGFVVVLRTSEVEQNPGILSAPRDPVEQVDILRDLGDLGHDLLRRRRIIPEIGGRALLAEVGQSGALGLDVKGNP